MTAITPFHYSYVTAQWFNHYRCFCWLNFYKQNDVYLELDVLNNYWFISLLLLCIEKVARILWMVHDSHKSSAAFALKIRCKVFDIIPASVAQMAYCEFIRVSCYTR